MGLRLKFNLVLFAVFLGGLSISGYVSYNLLQQNAQDEVLRNGGLMMETALAIRGYTTSQIQPHMNPMNAGENFFPQTVPAFSATETLNALRQKYPDYSYKEATLNPTNPSHKSVGWETEVVNSFRADSARSEITGIRAAANGARFLYVARPLQIKNPACLACHSVPEAAPPSMIKVYGPANGFGWKHNEIVGAQIVTVPLTLPVRNANNAFITFMLSLSAIFAVAFIALNIMLSVMIVEPISRMSRVADQISKGDFSEAEFASTGKDEISRLKTSFNRMRRSLAMAMQMLDKK
jgi:protein-histidine pros-kinase